MPSPTADNCSRSTADGTSAIRTRVSFDGMYQSEGSKFAQDTLCVRRRVGLRARFQGSSQESCDLAL